MAKLKLISFTLCPYVQRSVITLKKKSAPYEIEYIDLESPPEWFDRISPLGKVPVLVVDDKTVLFESAVINEYIDETVGEPMLARDPLARARERAWIAFGSELFMTSYHLFSTDDPAEIQESRSELFDSLSRVEAELTDGPYFAGPRFGLVDAAWAPLFTRLQLSPVIAEAVEWRKIPRTWKWARTLRDDLAVKDSVVPEFAEDYVSYGRENGSPLFPEPVT